MRLLAVNYHYYRVESPRSGIYPISPARFHKQVAVLAEQWKLASEAQFIEAMEECDDSEHGLCLITFDDGLKEQMNAVRWLASHDFAAVCYVPTAPFVERRVLDVHKLHIVRSLRSDAELASTLALRFGSLFTSMACEAASLQYPYDDLDAQKIKYFINFTIEADVRRRWLDDTFVDLVGDERKVAEALYMDSADLRELARLGMLGTHGHCHVPLAALRPDALREEIGRSLDIIEDLTGERVRGISYPYGGPTAADESVARAASELGLSYGMTMVNGINEPADIAFPLLLKRIDTNDVPAFTRRASFGA